MKTINTIGLLFIALLTIACDSKPSLQEYYVNKQDNTDFLLIDVPASLFLSAKDSNLSEDSKKALNSIKKANVLAFPITEETKKNFSKEKATITEILKDERYKLLMRMGSASRQVKISYLGEEDQIDEVIAFGLDDDKGFVVARILGNKMQPKAIMKLIKSAGEGDMDVNIESFGELEKIFKKGKNTTKKEKDTVQ